MYGGTKLEMRVLNEEFEQIAIIQDFSSLQWTQKYYESGQFILQVGLRYAHLLPDARYIYRVNTDVLGVIDSMKADKAFTMRGQFAGSQLMERAINYRVTYTGTAEEVCRAIVNEFCIEPEDPLRIIPHLILGEFQGLESEEVTVQPFGKTVFESIREVLTANEMSFRLRYVFETNDLIFEVYRGLDRTQSQTENDWRVFSADLYNVSNEAFTRTMDTRNYAYVVNGNEDNNEDEFVTIVEIDDGRPRAEVWVQDNTRLTEDMTEEEFEAAIRQTGLNKLAEFNIADTSECTIAVDNIDDYAIGDKCTYINKRVGVTIEQRITEIREVFEPNNVSTAVVLGKDQLTVGKKILREVK
jgi:hypothetical protein